MLRQWLLASRALSHSAPHLRHGVGIGLRPAPFAAIALANFTRWAFEIPSQRLRPSARAASVVRTSAGDLRGLGILRWVVRCVWAQYCHDVFVVIHHVRRWPQQRAY